MKRSFFILLYKKFTCQNKTCTKKTSTKLHLNLEQKNETYKNKIYLLIIRQHYIKYMPLVINQLIVLVKNYFPNRGNRFTMQPEHIIIQ